MDGQSRLYDKEADTVQPEATVVAEPAVDVDNIWLVLGQYGRYQMIQLLVLLVTVWSCCFHMLSIVFIGYRPVYECQNSYNLSAIRTNVTDVKVEYSKCSVTSHFNTSGVITTDEIACTSGWNYTYPTTHDDFPAERSFVSEWDLVCARGEIPEITQTLMMLGQGFGAFIFTSLSDKLGRKPTCVFCHVGLFLVTLATAFVPSYGYFIALRILTGSLQQGVTLTLTILNLEMFPANIRSMVEVGGLLFWSTGIALITPLAYVLRNTSWRYLQICLSCLSAWSLIQWWLTDESLRWLIANGKYEQAKQLIKKACKWNKKNYTDVMKESGFELFERKSTMLANTDGKHISDEDEGHKLVKNGDAGTKVADSNQAVTKYTVIDLVKSKRLFLSSLIIWFAWITDSLTYYGIMLLSSSLAGNRFVNFFLGSAVDYPAALLEYLMFDRFGRKVTCITFQSICCVSLILATILTTLAGDSQAMLVGSTVCTLIGKFAITGSFSTLFLYTPELYPTNMRNVGIGMASAAARIGAMIAPFSRNLAEVSIWAPGLIYGIMCAIVSLSLLWVPETNKRELPQTLAETEVWYRDNRFRLSRQKSAKTDDNVKI